MPTISFTRLLLLILLAALHTACTSDSKKSVDDVVSDAVSQSSRGDLADTGSPEYYIRLASEAEGEERQQYLLKAAELLIKRGDISLAESQLRHLQPDQLEHNKQIQIKLLAARIALANDNPVQAIELLPPMDLLNMGQQIDAAGITADAYHKLGYHMQAVITRVEIEHLIEADDLREQNHEAIWLALSSMPEIELNRQRSADLNIQGWLDLAQRLRRAQTSHNRLQQSILDWGTQYPNHPVSNAFIDNIIDLHLANRRAAEHIAVMLPLQGRYRAVSEAIRSGFLSAHFDNDNEQKPHIRFYDTADPNTSFNMLYQRALLEGARTIVGPLDKTAINQLAQNNALDVPVLTLNYAEDPLSQASNLFQFGLLPEDEAHQAAELAIRDGKKRAVILSPATAWGNRLQYAFSTRFRQLGGKIVSTQSYNPDKDDYSKPIQKMFNIDQSNRRHRDLQNLLDTKLKFTPYRRQDVDMIFLAATSRAARGIMPAFKFHHAGKLPVYATSHVYTGQHNRNADSDLNGIIFCDLPWIITSKHKLKRDFSENWPEHSSFTRLFAMGLDAYHLVHNLNYLQNNQYARFPGETGNLYLDENGRIHRDLVWAQFRKGLPIYLEPHQAPVTAPAITPPGIGDSIEEHT